MAQNNCSPSSIYGDFEQTLFCGCSVIDFAVQVGWNEQSSSLTVNIAEDPCTGNVKKYWDETLTARTTTGADPGFTYPDVGSPAYFRVADFEYCGIIQSWTQKKGANGNPTFSIKLSDPRVVLDSVQIIVDDYVSSVNNLYNLINVYGYLEATDLDCPTVTVNGVQFGSPAGGFGGSSVNSRGIPWNKIKGALNVLTSAQTKVTNQWSPYGRILYVGANPAKDSYGVIAADASDTNLTTLYGASQYIAEYLIDTTELPTITDDYRINGPSLSFTDLIKKVCTDFGLDYYIELIPVNYGGTLYKIIKVRTASRRSQPSLNAISTFVNNATGVINNTVGREIRNEATSVFLVGGKEQQLYQTPNTGLIVPYFGVDYSGAMIQTQYNATSGWTPALDIERLNLSLTTPFTGDYSDLKGSGYLDITERELQIALSEDTTYLQTYATSNNTKFGEYVSSVLGIGSAFVDVSGAAIPDFAGDTYIPGDYVGSSTVSVLDSNPALKDDYKKITEYISQFAKEYYGRQFLVEIPFTCYEYNASERTFIWSDEPSQDGAWNDFSGLLGLPFPSLVSDFFTNDDGRVNSLLRYSAEGTGIDTSVLSNDDYIGTTGTIPGTGAGETSSTGINVWVKTEIDSNWVIGRPQDPSAQIAYALLKTPAPVLVKTTGLLEAMADDPYFADKEELAAIRARREDPDDLTVSVMGGIETVTDAPGKFVPPLLAAVPLKSNVNNYGPWGYSGPPGATSFISDEGLTPWSYGSRYLMNQAAVSTVSTASTFMREGERGLITVPGYPDIPLGAELLSTQSGVLGNQRFVETRVGVTDTYLGITWVGVSMGASDGTYGPCVTNTSVNVGAGGVTTTYTLSTFTPSYGEFSKKNAERLQRQGQQKLADIRRSRANQKVNETLSKIKSIGRDVKRIEESSLESSRKPTPMMIVAPGVSEDASTGVPSRRRPVGAATADDIAKLPAGGVNTAVASYDTFYTPVSKTQTDFSFPPFASGNAETEGKAWSASPQIPADNVIPLVVDATYYDRYPLSSSQDSSVISRDSSTGINKAYPLDNIIGHTGVNKGATNSRYTTYPKFSDDIATFAHKGPLLLKSWGYDTEGRPVPNVADVNAANGIFATNGTFANSGFYPNFLEYEKTWPCAPIDLRYDRLRGVWTTPPPIPIKYATLDSSGNFNFVGSYEDGSGNTTGLYVHESNVGNVPAFLGSGTGIGQRYPLYWDDGWRFLSVPALLKVFESGNCPSIASCATPANKTEYDVQQLVFRNALDVTENVTSGGDLQAIIDVEFGTFNVDCTGAFINCATGTFSNMIAPPPFKWSDYDNTGVASCGRQFIFNPPIADQTGYVRKTEDVFGDNDNRYVIQKFNLRDGIAGSWVTGEECTGLALNTDLRITDTPYCGITGLGIDDQTFFHLNFRTGLVVNSGDQGTYFIDVHSLVASGTGTGDLFGTTITASTLLFDTEYFILSSSECYGYVTLNPDKIGGSGDGGTGTSPVGTGVANEIGPCDLTSNLDCFKNDGCLIFGTGLEVEQRDGDVVVYQNPLVNIGSSGYICDTEDPSADNFEAQTFREIIFGSGMTVTGAGTCTATVDAVPYVYVNKDDTFEFSTPFQGINFLPPFGVELNSSNSCFADVSLTGALFEVGSSVNTCDTAFGESGALACSPVYAGACLSFGDGLQISAFDPSGNIRIDAVPRVRVINANSGIGGSTGVDVYAAIEFGDGFSIGTGQVATGIDAANSNCVVKVDFTGDPCPLKVSNIAGSCDKTEPFTETQVYSGIEIIKFGQGLEVQTDNASGSLCGEITVYQNPLTNILGSGGLTTITEGSTGLFSTLAFPDCFEIKPDGCTAVVDLDGIDREVETVCNIQCGDGTVTVDKITMGFKCGLLTGVTTCAGSTETETLDGSNPLFSASTNTPISAAANENQKVFFVSAALGDTLLTLHEASAVTGRQYSFKKTDATVNQVVVSGTGSNTIDGQPTFTLTNQYEVVKVMSDGSQWYII